MKPGARFTLATLAATALLALATARFVGRAAAARIGDATARQLGALAARLPAPAVRVGSNGLEATAPLPAFPGEAPADGAPHPPVPPHGVRHAASSRAAPQRAALSSPSPPRATLDIPAARLAPLTEKQLRSLRADDATGADGRAAGARLVGFGALGLGLDDGDIVTSIDGHATPDVSRALAAAFQAYGSGEEKTYATVMRGGRPLDVVVHIPRPLKPL